VKEPIAGGGYFFRFSGINGDGWLVWKATDKRSANIFIAKASRRYFRSVGSITPGCEKKIGCQNQLVYLTGENRCHRFGLKWILAGFIASEVYLNSNKLFRAAIFQSLTLLVVRLFNHIIIIMFAMAYIGYCNTALFTARLCWRGSLLGLLGLLS
jgi:hypothetical protein